MKIEIQKTTKITPKLTFECPLCKDVGFTWWQDEKGYEYAAECSCTKQKRIKARIRDSGIAPVELENKTFETFKIDTAETKKMKTLAEKYLQDKNALGIGFFGRSGTGKTHICIAICNELIKRDQEVKYFSYRTEMQKLLRSYYKDDYEDLIDKFNAVQVLYIDDLLKFAKSSKGDVLETELRILYDIINYRYLNHKKTLFSSEYALGTIIRDIDEALGTRIYAMVAPYGIKCEGENRRVANGK